MIAYDIKKILDIAPEALPLIKEAVFSEEYPTNNKSSICASYLRAEYQIRHDNTFVDPELRQALVKAAHLYRVKDELDAIAEKFQQPGFEKSAQEDLLEKIGLFEEYAMSLHKPSKAAEVAELLVNSTEREDVRCYAGLGYLNKEAAVASLVRRYQTCKSPQYVKLAHQVVDHVKENDFTKIASLCKAVTKIDEINGLDVLGFDFYKEATHAKIAASSLTVTLAGKSVPMTAIQKVDDDLFKETAGIDKSSADLVDLKYGLEALPRDSQITLRRLCGYGNS
jgi:hypothetical protein